MREEIFINDERMDLDAGFKGVQMVFQSPYLTDLKSIVSNRTNSINLPPTLHNLGVIGLTSVQQVSNFAYRKHRAIYKRDGVQMLRGTATLLSVTDKGIQMCFTWGNVQAFQKLFDTKLSELALLGSGEQYIQYNDPVNSVLQPYFAMPVNCGMGRKQPALMVSDILSRIQTKCGVTGLTTPNEWKWMGVLMNTRNGDTTTRNVQRLRFGDAYPPVNGKKQFASGNKKALLFGPAAATKVDVHNYFDDDSKWFYTNGETKVKIVYDADIYFKYDYYSAFALEDVELDMIFSEDGSITADTRKEKIADAELVDSGSYGETGPYWRLYRVNANVTKTFDVNGATYIGLRLCTFPQATIAVDAFIDSDNGSVTTIDITFDPDEGEDVIWGCPYDIVNYPMWYNLPDMSCGDFVKSLMLLFGKFAFCKDDTNIIFTDFDQLFANKSIAKDWTQKMLTLHAKERKTILDDFAQTNYVKYQEDESVPEGVLDGVILCDDENLPLEETLYENQFTLPYGNNALLWQINEDEVLEYVGDERAPILIAADFSGSQPSNVQAMGYQERLKWVNLLADYYDEYQVVVNQPVVLKAEFALDVADLYGLDLRVPVYLKQTGRFYAIRKLTTKNLEVAEAELIEL